MVDKGPGILRRVQIGLQKGVLLKLRPVLDDRDTLYSKRECGRWSLMVYLVPLRYVCWQKSTSSLASSWPHFQTPH